MCVDIDRYRYIINKLVLIWQYPVGYVAYKIKYKVISLNRENNVNSECGGWQ